MTVALKYSTFWRRFCALIIDGLFFLLFAHFCSYLTSRSDSVPLHILIYLVNSTAYLVYFIWMHGKLGQTLGKMACRIKVVDISENPLSMKQAVLRNIVELIFLPISFTFDIPRILKGINIEAEANSSTIEEIVSYLFLGWFFAEIITMFRNNKRRAIHDYIAGSVVVRTTDVPTLQPDQIPSMEI